MQLRVYYSPNLANNKIVPLLAELGKGKFDFIPLHESHQERVKQLPELPDRAVFLWGDGHRHHESFYFTKGRSIDAKMNIDQHDDARPYGPLDCGNHMHHSRLHNITPIIDLDRPSKLAALAGPDYDHLSLGKLAVTVDCDVIIGFPAIYEWVNNGHDGGLHASDVASFITALGPRIACLDLGGLIEFIPDFAFRPDPEVPNWKDAVLFGKPLAVYRFEPIYRTGRPRVVVPEVFSRLTRDLSQSTVDNLCSYAVVTYHQILDAFANTQFS